MARAQKLVDIDKILGELKKKDAKNPRRYDYESSQREAQRRIRLQRNAHLINKLMNAGASRRLAKVLVELFATKDDIPWDGRVGG